MQIQRLDTRSTEFLTRAQMNKWFRNQSGFFSFCGLGQIGLALKSLDDLTTSMGFMQLQGMGYPKINRPKGVKMD